MATKKKKPTKTIGGPFLAAAVFCENIMEDSSKKISAIGILDGCQLYLTPQAPPDVPSASNPLQFSQTLLLIFRTGDSPGKHNLRIVIQQPDGKRSEAMNQGIELSPEPHGGLNIKTNIVLGVYSSGVFWFDLIVDGKRLTRMPLNVSIQRLGEATQGPPIPSPRKKSK